jgi:membrane protease subunit HflC
METYRDILSSDSTLVLSTDSDLFKYLKNMEPDSPPASASAPIPRPTPRKKTDPPANQ